MRLRGLNHLDLCVPDYPSCLDFYDRMFGRLGYGSFKTGGMAYEATYYTALPHSYVGIHPAAEGSWERIDPERHAPGLHHVAIWARGRREVDRFHREFLVAGGVEVTDAPQEYPLYTPGYYAVFFRDPAGIRWELAHIPLLPTPRQILRFTRATRAGLEEIRGDGPRPRMRDMFRKLPRG
ncbi:MAG: VOC family protein [Myxococcales bacterium]|nr:VOC family protein [Myxococcales bacterium]